MAAIALAATPAAAQSSSPPPDLSISGTGNPGGAVEIGQNLTHTFTVRNEAETTADEVTFADVRPEGTEHVSSSCGGVGERSVWCYLGPLAGGQAVTVTIVLRATRAGEFQHRGDVYGPGGSQDSNPANNTAFIPITVNGPQVVLRPCHTGYRGTEDPNRIAGGDGTETIRGLGGSDLLYGGGGIDCLFGGAGDDVMEGGEGDDQLSGGSGDDRMKGDDGRDVMKGDFGNDRLTGGADRDSFDGGAGDDVIVSADGTRETVRCGNGSDRVSAARTDRIARDCEQVKRRR
jgi:uncharacterized repeat protein (TIGR01451 family)